MGLSKQQKATGPMRGKVYSPGGRQCGNREQVQPFWVKIAEGLSREDGALAVGVSSPVGTRCLREAGGMRPISVAPLSSRYLSFVEREEIAILKVQGAGVRQIARHIGRRPSTISRELRGNTATRSGTSGYRAVNAEWHATVAPGDPGRPSWWPTTAPRVREDRLSGLIARPDGTPVEGPPVRFIGRRHGRRQDRRSAKAWSPEADLQPAVVDFLDDETVRISTEAIYQALLI